jgi:hypothetical protein
MPYNHRRVISLSKILSKIRSCHGCQPSWPVGFALHTCIPPSLTTKFDHEEKYPSTAISPRLDPCTLRACASGDSADLIVMESDQTLTVLQRHLWLDLLPNACPLRKLVWGINSLFCWTILFDSFCLLGFNFGIEEPAASNGYSKISLPLLYFRPSVKIREISRAWIMAETIPGEVCNFRGHGWQDICNNSILLNMNDRHNREERNITQR